MQLRSPPQPLSGRRQSMCSVQRDLYWLPAKLLMMGRLDEWRANGDWWLVTPKTLIFDVCLRLASKLGHSYVHLWILDVFGDFLGVIYVQTSTNGSPGSYMHLHVFFHMSYTLIEAKSCQPSHQPMVFAAMHCVAPLSETICLTLRILHSSQTLVNVS